MSAVYRAEDALTKHNHMERSWVKEHMKDDPLWQRLPNVRWDYACIGRQFVAWTVVGSRPVIGALFQADCLGISEKGLEVTISIASTNGVETMPPVSYVPVKVPDLDLYFSIPYFAEVRCSPRKASGTGCSIPLLIKHRNPCALSQVENRLYFASKDDFVAIWPEHDF